MAGEECEERGGGERERAKKGEREREREGSIRKDTYYSGCGGADHDQIVEHHEKHNGKDCARLLRPRRREVYCESCHESSVTCRPTGH